MTLADILTARSNLNDAALCVRTPMVSHMQGTLGLAPDIHLYIKLESLQNSGSFKMRGVACQVKNIPEDVRSGERFLITMSAGNYGRAFASICHSYALKGLVVMPTTAPDDRETFIRVLKIGDIR